MPKVIDRSAVKGLVEEENAQLVEVLPRDEHDEEYLPDAIHLPLRRLDGSHATVLDLARPVIVYCSDGL
jgi:rhodanese-related sulfurtransferase